MRFLALFTALLLLGAPAFAGWNLQQKDTGATVWTDQDGNSVPAGGGSVINIRFSDLSTAATEYAVIRKAGQIVALYGVSMSPGSGGTAVDNTITLWLSALSGRLDNTAVVVTDYFKKVTGAEITLSALSHFGTYELDSSIDAPAEGGTDPSNDVKQGQIIAINTDGSGTGTTPAMITIVIE